MNWRAGFFRIWVAFTGVWLIFAIWVVYEDHIRWAMKATERIEKLESNSVSFRILPPSKSGTSKELFSGQWPRICLGADYDPTVSASESKVWPKTRIYCDLPKSLLDQIDLLGATQDSEIDRFLTDELFGLTVKDAELFVIERELSEKSERYKKAVSIFLFLGLLPPIVLMFFGWVAAWILKGFKARA